MKALRIVSGVAAVAMLAPLAEVAEAVPSFSRATGLTCNQCHTTWAPVPDFTFTGRKFRLNGYRAPWVADKLEAGSEGALDGRRLTLGLQNAFALRIRSDLFDQFQAASNPASRAPDPSAVTADPGAAISWFYAGPLGENFGIWNKFSLTEDGDLGDRYRLTTFDEYDFKFVMSPYGEHIVGFAFTTQALSCLAGFCPFTSSTPNYMQQGDFEAGGTQFANMAVYGLFDNRVGAVFGVQPGEDNLDFSRMNFMGILAYWLANHDAKQLVANVQFKAGNDAIPIVTVPHVGFQSKTWVYREAVRGVAATRGAGASPYLSYNTGDFVRTLGELYYEFVDRGSHSLASAAGVSFNNETYDDGAATKHSAWGLRTRYLYDRTFGLEGQLAKVMDFEFTDVQGHIHDIPQDITYRGYVTYRPAMNIAVFVSGGNSQAAVLDENWRDGWDWTVRLDLIF